MFLPSYTFTRVWRFACLLVVCVAFSTASAGPDNATLPSCAVFHTELNSHERHSLRDLVQALHTAKAPLAATRLGRSRPTSQEAADEATLSASTAAMFQKLRNLVDSARIASQAGLSGTDAAVALATSCMSARLHPDGFAGRPLVSVLLNYFKRPQVVHDIARQMRASCHAAAVPCELVVNVDNPEEAGAWAGEAGFVVPVFSANLHESRGYNRAARLARGKYLVIWQDDQIPPSTGTWLTQMVRLFETYPQLGVVGMNSYRMCRQRERGNRWGPAGWDKDPRVGFAWSYVHFADFAPLAVPAAVFWALGGLDEGLSRRGECGIMGDWELCARAWVAGWQVAHFWFDGRSGDPVAVGGTHLPVSELQCWHRQMDVAGGTFTKRFIQPQFVQEMCERVWALNMLTFSLSDPSRCPYGNQFANCTAPPPGEARAELAARMQVPLPPDLPAA